MESKFYDEKPNLFDNVRSTGVITTIIRLNIKEVDDEETGKKKWSCEEIEYDHKEPLSEADYGSLIRVIVRAKFTTDDVEAIQQNYMESKTKGHKADFSDLKAWRTLAKETAKAILGMEG